VNGNKKKKLVSRGEYKMETILATKREQAPDCITHPGREIRMPEIRHWKSENKKRKEENRDWILKRGYWKPETPSCIIQSGREIRRSGTGNTGLRKAVKQWNLANGKRNEEFDYWVHKWSS